MTETHTAFLKHGPYAGVIGVAMRHNPDSEIWTFALQSNNLSWQMLASDLTLLEALPTSRSARVGAWQVEVTPLNREVIAYKADSNLTHSAPLTRFPNGWKVGEVWSTPVPATVQRAANRLARELTA